MCTCAATDELDFVAYDVWWLLGITLSENKSAESKNKYKLAKHKKALEGGFEPPTLWLTATRSNQLSYSSFLYMYTTKLNKL